MSVFVLALSVNCAACGLMYRGDVVPKDVSVALALTVGARGDVAK